MTGTAINFDDDGGFDLGPERPTQPPEADITEAELDALRARLKAEIEELAQSDEWWGDMTDDPRVVRDLCIVASLVMQDHPIAARYTLGFAIDRAVEEREREEVSGG